MRQQAAGDVTASQLSALSSIAKHGEVSLGALANFERVAPPSMTRIAGRLEEMGLVERRPDTADRRVALVAVTEEGRRILAETRTRRDAYLAERIREMTGEEQAVLAEAVPLLERLASHGGVGWEGAEVEGAGAGAGGAGAGGAGAGAGAQGGTGASDAGTVAPACVAQDPE